MRPRPPITPPTMAPVLLLDDDFTDGGEDVDMGAEDGEVTEAAGGLIVSAGVVGCDCELVLVELVLEP